MLAHLGFSTMNQQFLVFVYVGVWVIQGGYFGYVAWQWFHTKKPVDGSGSLPRRG